jgi:hypothetical protein
MGDSWHKYRGISGDISRGLDCTFVLYIVVVVRFHMRRAYMFLYRFVYMFTLGGHLCFVYIDLLQGTAS